MAINLEKGQSISLKKQAPKLEGVRCGLGWDVAKTGFFGMFSSNANFDLDASVLCLNERERLEKPANLIYFGNLRHISGAVTHLGDNLTGKGEGDDERIVVHLNELPPNIYKLVFIVNIYDAINRQQDFSKVQNAFVRLVDLSNQQEIARYSLSGSGYEGKTSMIMAEIVRQDNDWNMTAVGKGLKVSNLQEIIHSYL